MLRYTIPIWLTMCLSALSGVIDFAFLRNFSEQYYTVVSIAYVPFSIIGLTIVGLNIQANRYYTIHHSINLKWCIFYASCMSLSWMIIAHLLTPYLFFFYHGDKLILSMHFFTILLWSLIPLSWIMVCSGILRGKGTPQQQIPFSIAVLLFNAMFNYVLIYKLNIFPVNAVAYATTVADWIIAIGLVMFTKTHLNHAHHFPHADYIKNVILLGCEKLFSSGSLMVLPNMFVSNFAITESSLYFAWSTYALPILIYAHAYFEWVIYKHIQFLTKEHGLHIMGFTLLAIVTVILINVMHMGMYKNTFLFNVYYISFLVLFFVDRAFTAILFNHNRAMTSTKINTMMRSFQVLILLYLQYVSWLQFKTFMVVMIMIEMAMIISYFLLLPTAIAFKCQKYRRGIRAAIVREKI